MGPPQIVDIRAIVAFFELNDRVLPADRGVIDEDIT